MYKVILIALLLVLPSVLSSYSSSPYEDIYEIGKRASVRELIKKILKNERFHKLGCSATCSMVAGWLSFLCPPACSIIVDKLEHLPHHN